MLRCWWPQELRPQLLVVRLRKELGLYRLECTILPVHRALGKRYIVGTLDVPLMAIRGLLANALDRYVTRLVVHVGQGRDLPLQVVMVPLDLHALHLHCMIRVFLPVPLPKKGGLSAFLDVETGTEILDLLTATLLRLASLRIVLQLRHYLVEILVEYALFFALDEVGSNFSAVNAHELVPDFVEDQRCHLRA